MNTFKIFWSSLFASIFFVLEVVFRSLASIADTIVDSLFVALKILGITLLVILGAFVLYMIAYFVIGIASLF